MDQFSALRAAVAALGPAQRGRTIPPELRAHLMTAARASVAAGRSRREIAAGLGVTVETVRRWLGSQAGAASPAAPLRVKPRAVLVAVEAPKVPGPPAGRSLSLTSPSGWRIDGLTVADVVELVERLR